jgi:hypothetical protein
MLQIIGGAFVDSATPFHLKEAYPGSTVTMSGVSFWPSTQTCTVLVCNGTSTACRVLSATTIEFDINSTIAGGECPVTVRLQVPDFVIQSSIRISAFPSVNSTSVPSRAYFGSLLSLQFNRLFTAPFLCFSEVLCVLSDKFNETSASFRLPSSGNTTFVTSLTVRIRNPDYQIALLNPSFLMAKGPQIRRIEFPVPHTQSEFLIHGVSFWEPCLVKEANGTRELLQISTINSTVMSAAWRVDPTAVRNSQMTISAMLSCSSCGVNETWCNREEPSGIFFFSLVFDDENNAVLGSSLSTTFQLQRASYARPYSIKIDTSFPVRVTAGDTRTFNVELVDQSNNTLSEAAVLTASALLVTKVGMNGTENKAAFYQGSHAVYNLKHLKAENVSLIFQDAALGGILATYYRDARFVDAFASGVQSDPWLRPSSNVALQMNSFRWEWLLRPSLSGRCVKASLWRAVLLVTISAQLHLSSGCVVF